MNTLIAASENAEFEELTGTPPVLADICGKTVLERLIERLIAAGIEKAFIASRSPGRIHQSLADCKNSDKIKLCIYSSDEQLTEKGEPVLVCDPVGCFCADIASALKGLPLEDIAPTAFKTPDGERIIACIVPERDVKQIDFTTCKSVFTELSNVCIKTVKLNSQTGNIVTPLDVLCCQGYLLNKEPLKTVSLTDSNYNGVTIIPPVHIGRNVILGSGAIIEKGTVIADNARICGGARVSGSYVGRCAVIGRNCDLRNTYVADDAVLMNRVRTLGNCIVGHRCIVKANTTLSEDTVVKPSDVPEMSNVFLRGAKPLVFDDDGICSLFEASDDPTSYCELGKAVGTSLPLGSRVIVGRGSYDGMAPLSEALCCGVISTGTNVLNIGVCTFQQLCFAAHGDPSVVGIYIGVDANGDVRLIQSGGLPLVSGLERSICRSFDTKSFRLCAPNFFGRVCMSESVSEDYYRSLREMLPTSMKGLNVAVRTSDELTARLCDRLFCPSNDICGEKVYFSLAGDLSCVTAYSEATENVQWERLCMLGCKIMFENHKPVSIPYNFPSAFDELAAKQQGTLTRYCTVRVDGSDNSARVIACSPDNAFVRDGLMLIVMICRYLNDNKLTLAQALRDIRHVFTSQRYEITLSAPENALDSLENSVAVGSEGYEVCNKLSRAFVRPSKDKTSVMIFAESANAEFASELCGDIAQKLRNYGRFGHF